MTMILQRRINIDKKIIKFLLIGLLIRLLLMPFFTHWDLPALYEMVHYISFHKVKDIYTLIYNNFNHWAAVYPPLTFFSLAGYLFLIKRFTLLFDVAPHFDLNSTFYPLWVTSVQASRYLFLLKIPYLIFDLAMAYLLTLFFEDKGKKLKILKFWMFCPITLYVTFMFGQFDIIPTFFVILSLYFLKKQKINLSFLTLGMATALKNYPLFLLLPLVLIVGGSIFSMVKNFALGVGPFILTILPFINKQSFRDPVLYSGTSGYLFKNKIMVAEGDSLIPFFICYGIILFYFLIKTQLNRHPELVSGSHGMLNQVQHDKKWENSKTDKNGIFSDSLFASTLVLLSFFSFSYFHPQWLLWLMPFIGLYLVEIKEIKYLYWIVVLLFIPYLFHFSSSTSWLLFDVVNPNLFHYLKTPKQFIFQFYNADNLLHIFRSFLTGALILISYFILTVKKKTGEGINT